MTLLRIGDFSLNGTRDQFYGEYLNTLTGWEDGTSMRSTSRSRGQQHGNFDVPPVMESRTVNFTASKYAKSRADLTRRGLAFTSLLSQGNSRMVSIELEGLTLWGHARAGGAKPTWKQIPGRLAIARASMELEFADPRRYGDDAPVGPAVSGVPFEVFQYGTFPATPAFTINGSMPNGYVLSMDAGRQFRVAAALVEGHPHVIDMTYGSLSIDGFVTAGLVPRADTWAIPPGFQPVHTLVPITTGAARIETALRDTY